MNQILIAVSIVFFSIGITLFLIKLGQQKGAAEIKRLQDEVIVPLLIIAAYHTDFNSEDGTANAAEQEKFKKFFTTGVRAYFRGKKTDEEVDKIISGILDQIGSKPGI